MQGKVTKKTRKCKQCKGPCKGHPCENDEPPDEIEKQSENECSPADKSMEILGNGFLEKDDLPEEIFKLATKEEMVSEAQINLIININNTFFLGILG